MKILAVLNEQEIEPMFSDCWTNIADDGSTMRKYRFNILLHSGSSVTHVFSLSYTSILLFPRRANYLTDYYLILVHQIKAIFEIMYRSFKKIMHVRLR